jgi:hypothetical protein
MSDRQTAHSFELSRPPPANGIALVSHAAKSALMTRYDASVIAANATTRQKG